jgi:hypothetical protein
LLCLSSETKIKVESKSFGKRLIMNENFVDKGGKAWVMSTKKSSNFLFAGEIRGLGQLCGD